MAGVGTSTRATAVATPVSTEGVALYIAAAPDDMATPSLASLPGSGTIISNRIDGTMNITAGAGTTAVVIKCRRGNGITGTQIGTSQTVTLAAGASDNIPFRFQDGASPVPPGGNSSGNGYSITVTQTGGTGAGTVNEIVGDVASYI